MRQLKRIFIKGLLTKKQREPTRDRKALQCNKEECVNTPRTEGAMEEMVRLSVYFEKRPNRVCWLIPCAMGAKERSPGGN